MPSRASVLNVLGWRPGLVAKFVFLASVVVVVLSAVGNRLLLSREQERVYRSAEQKTRLLVESASIPFTHTLLYEEIGLLEESGLLDSIIRDLLSKPELDVVRVMVMSTRGRVTAHNDYSELGKTYRDSLSLRAIRASGTLVQHLVSDGTRLLDVSTPLQLSYKRWGTLRMVVSLAGEQAEVRAYARWLMGMTAMAILMGIGLAAAVASALARPIRTLEAAMGRVEADLTTDLVQDRFDEIGRLQAGFLDMVHRVRRAVSERADAQRMLQHSDRLASLGTMAAGMAHEISNPLTGLRACLERIEREPENARQSRRYARLMLDRLDPVEHVVRSMLNFARREDSVKSPVDIREIVGEALSLSERRLSESDVEVTVASAPDMGPVMGDRHQLVQVFLNLILNAVDAMPGGGRLHLACSGAAGQAVIRVTDTGCGIPEDLVSRVFDPFFTTKDTGQGTGLGLSIAHGIVTEHRGSMTVESRDGAGAAFCVILPCLDKRGGNQEDEPDSTA